jgi:hypothetical protein
MCFVGIPLAARLRFAGQSGTIPASPVRLARKYREEKLCVYTAQQFEYVRVEACETCRSYLKSIDLTNNGLAVPEVGDLASTPLTLWAEESGS